ncbi:MAG: hypothetical protein QXY39_03450 [Thermofilaceae archaeon]
MPASRRRIEEIDGVRYILVEAVEVEQVNRSVVQLVDALHSLPFKLPSLSRILEELEEAYMRHVNSLLARIYGVDVELACLDFSERECGAYVQTFEYRGVMLAEPELLIREDIYGKLGK